MKSFPTVEIVGFAGCPNLPLACELVRSTLATTTIPARVVVSHVVSVEDAIQRRFTGSPTILVDGVDIDPSWETRIDYGLSCRVYPGIRGSVGAPPQAWLVRALREALSRQS